MADAAQFEVLDPGFGKIVSEGAMLNKLATGMKFTEGPVYMPKEDCVLFSDIPQSRIMRWSAADGLSIWREPSGQSNGNILDRQGRLITCEHNTRRVTRTSADGELTVLATEFDGKRLNSPNDAVVKSDGAIWFTDPTYGIQKEDQEQTHKNVFRLVPDTGGMASVVSDFDMPNGLCFSPDEKTLYIADSGKPHHVRKFAVSEDNVLSGGEVFAVIAPGVPDGMRVDADGRLYCTAGDGVHVFAPDGRMLGKVLVPETPANCCFGGKDGRTLFITARSSLYSIELKVKGAGM